MVLGRRLLHHHVERSARDLSGISAAASAASSMMGPRAVFTMYAVFFICRNVLALNRYFVSGTSGL